MRRTQCEERTTGQRLPSKHVSRTSGTATVSANRKTTLVPAPVAFSEYLTANALGRWNGPGGGEARGVGGEVRLPTGPLAPTGQKPGHGRLSGRLLFPISGKGNLTLVLRQRGTGVLGTSTFASSDGSLASALRGGWHCRGRREGRPWVSPVIARRRQLNRVIQFSARVQLVAR